jgi:hypothetical protein
MQSDQIFNERGLLRDDLENVVVPPERQVVFDSLVSAICGAEAAEEDARRKDTAVTDAVRNHAKAVAAAPKTDFMTEWRAAVGKPAVVSSTAGEGAASATGLLDTTEAAPLVLSVRDADESVNVARAELRQSRAALTLARERVGKALAFYNAAAPSITPEQNTRAWIESNNAERAARVAMYGNYRPNVTQSARSMGGGVGPGPRQVGVGPAGEPIISGGTSRAGGGAAYRRGPGGQPAYTKREAAILNARRNAAIAAGTAAPPNAKPLAFGRKLPSER